MFFSEEKNQKTFISGAAPSSPAMAWNGGAFGEIKVFCFPQGGLRLFFRKEGLSFLLP
jgi:hypothetical protein